MRQNKIEPLREMGSARRTMPLIRISVVKHRVAFNAESPIRFNVTASSALSSIRFSQSFGQLYLDDISVEPAGVGVPDGGTTVSLLGCALVGLAALRRKLPLLRGRKS